MHIYIYKYGDLALVQSGLPVKDVIVQPAKRRTSKYVGILIIDWHIGIKLQNQTKAFHMSSFDKKNHLCKIQTE